MYNLFNCCYEFWWQKLLRSFCESFSFTFTSTYNFFSFWHLGCPIPFQSLHHHQLTKPIWIGSFPENAETLNSCASCGHRNANRTEHCHWIAYGNLYNHNHDILNIFSNWTWIIWLSLHSFYIWFEWRRPYKMNFIQWIDLNDAINRPIIL